MNKLLKSTLIVISLTGCAEPTKDEIAEEICQETNSILKELMDKGMNPHAMQNCIKQGPEKAKKDLEKWKKMTGR